jgi:hypothetical protein
LFCDEIIYRDFYDIIWKNRGVKMEAVPKLPMISFELKTSPENTHFGPKLKQVSRSSNLTEDKF